MYLKRWACPTALVAFLLGIGLSAALGQEPQLTTMSSSCLPAGCFDPCSTLPGGFWIGADLLGWGGKGDRLPPLITASPPGTPRSQAGVLGTPGVTVLFGDDRVNEDVRLGFRINGGLWLDCCRTIGFEGDVFFLDPTSAGVELFSLGSLILARPFLNALIGSPDAELVAFPGVLRGAVSAADSATVWGGTLNARANLWCGCNCRLDVLAGYRFLGLSDTLTVGESLKAIDPASEIVPGTQFQIADRFRTTNGFHGAQIGLKGEHWIGRTYLGWNASVALGDVHQTIDIGGGTRVTVPGLPPSALPGGLLALGSNSGRFVRDDFAVVPVCGLQAGYQITSGLRALVGYDFLYLSHVTRPGDVIDLAVNPGLLPPPIPGGPARPALTDNHSDFWLQGISGGMELKF